ncbi:MAG: hypothetical protein CMI27_03980 [Opitutae bacterium]|nr:hypothetical protein [Opitutae bacterium]
MSNLKQFTKTPEFFFGDPLLSQVDADKEAIKQVRNFQKPNNFFPGDLSANLSRTLSKKFLQSYDEWNKGRGVAPFSSMREANQKFRSENYAKNLPVWQNLFSDEKFEQALDRRGLKTGYQKVVNTIGESDSLKNKFREKMFLQDLAGSRDDLTKARVAKDVLKHKDHPEKSFIDLAKQWVVKQNEKVELGKNAYKMGIDAFIADDGKSFLDGLKKVREAGPSAESAFHNAYYEMREGDGKAMLFQVNKLVAKAKSEGERGLFEQKKDLPEASIGLIAEFYAKPGGREKFLMILNNKIEQESSKTDVSFFTKFLKQASRFYESEIGAAGRNILRRNIEESDRSLFFPDDPDSKNFETVNGRKVAKKLSEQEKAYFRNVQQVSADISNVKQAVSQIDGENWFSTMILDQSGTLAQMPLIMNPVGFYTRYDSQRQLDTEEMLSQNPNLSYEEARGMARFSAGMNVFSERLATGFFLKKFPTIKNVTSKIKGANPVSVAQAFRRAGVAAAGITGAEYLQESFQEATLPLTLDLFSALKEDMPYGNWDQFKMWDQRRFLAVLPLAILGGGGQSARDTISTAELGKVLLAKNDVMISGRSEKQAQEVAELAMTDPDAALALYKKQGESMSKEEQEAFGNEAMRNVYSDQLGEEFAAMPIARQTEDGKFSLDFQDGRKEEYDSVAERDQALENWSKEEFFQTREAMEAFAKMAKERVEGEADFKIERPRTFQDLADQGVETEANLKKAIGVYYSQMGEVAPDKIDLANYIEEGSVSLKRNLSGFAVRLAQGASPITVAEEFSEGFIRRAVGLNETSFDEVKALLDEFGEMSGIQMTEGYDIDPERAVIEGFSKFSKAYALQGKYDMLPKETQSWMSKAWAVMENSNNIPGVLKAFSELFSKMFKAVYDVAKAIEFHRAKGAGIDPDLESMALRALGFDEKGYNERMQERANQEALEETFDPSDELFQQVKGKLPNPRLTDVGKYKSDLMRIHDSMVKVSNKKLKSGKRRINNKAADNFFLPKGVDASVEQVMLDLNDQGFDFESELDFLDAVLDSVDYQVTDGTTGSKLFPITLGDTIQGDYTFSVGRSEVTPTADTQVFPTKDGGVVGPASFSISAFHGTPHKVDEFSTEQIGTGEGAQAYGYGLYFAESEDVAQRYRDDLTDTGFAKRRLKKAGGDIDVALTEARERASKYRKGGADAYASAIEQDIRFLEKYKESGEWASGSLYTVELNVEQDELLDWNKPMSEQSESIRSKMLTILQGDASMFLDVREAANRLEKGEYLDGRQAYNQLQSTIGSKRASEALVAAGIKGIRYLDGNSRNATWKLSSPDTVAAGDWMVKDSSKPLSNGVHFNNEAEAQAFLEEKNQGTFNYVIFNDADITITEENGQVVDTTKPSFSITPAQDAGNIETLFKDQIDPLISYTYPALKGDSQAETTAKIKLLEALEENDQLSNYAIETIEQYSDDILDEFTREVMEGKDFSEIVEEQEQEIKDDPDSFSDDFSTEKNLTEWLLNERGEGQIENSGYAFPDGTLLHMSHYGFVRDVDHREVHFPNSPGGTEGMVAIMNAGIMRFDYSGGGVTLRHPPTRAQADIIARIASHTEVFLDAEQATSDGYNEKRRASFEITDEFAVDDVINSVRAFYRGRDFEGISTFAIQPVEQYGAITKLEKKILSDRVNIGKRLEVKLEADEKNWNNAKKSGNQQEIERAAQQVMRRTQAYMEVLPDYPMGPTISKAQDLAEKVLVGSIEITEGIKIVDENARYSGLPIKLPSWLSNLKVADWVKRNLRARGDLTPDQFKIKLASEAITLTELKRAELINSRLKKAVKKEALVAPNSEGVLMEDFLMKRVQDALVMDGAVNVTEAISKLPESLQSVTKEMRVHVDSLSREMIKKGIAKGDLADVFQRNIGSYLNRSYRRFTRPEKWKHEVSEESKKNAMQWLEDNLPAEAFSGDVSKEDQLEGYVDTLLTDSVSGGFTDQMNWLLGQKHIGNLIARKKVPVELRELWGEYKRGDENYMTSVRKMATQIGNHTMLTEFLKNGLNTEIFSTPRKGFSKQISSKGNEMLSPLDGYYVSEGMSQALIDFSESGETTAWWLKLWLKFNSVAKVTKTIYNPTTHARNFLSNFVYVGANGNLFEYLNIDTVKMSATINYKEIFKSWETTKDVEDRILHYIRLGIMQQGAVSQEFKDILNDFSAGDVDIDEYTQNSAKKFAKAGLKKIESLYQAEDDFHKIVSYEAERAKLAKAKTEWKSDKLDAEAAQIVRDTMPDYSQVPNAVKMLRRVPFIGTFTSFTSEVIRNNTNIIQRAKFEMSDPELRSIGAKRLSSFAVAHSIPLAGAYFLASFFGVDDEEDEATRAIAAPWDKYAQLLYVGRTPSGDPQYINISYTDPFSVFKTPIFVSQQDGFSPVSVAKGILMGLEPFYGEEIGTAALLDIRENKNEKIFNPNSDAWTITKDISEHILKAVEPGVVRSTKRIYEAATGKETDSGMKLDTRTEVIAVLSGQRITSIDRKKAILYRNYDFQDALRSSTYRFNKAWRNKNVDKKELSKAYKQYKKDNEKAYSEFQDALQAVSRLGLTEEQILLETTKGKDNTETAKRLLNLLRAPAGETPMPDKKFTKSQIKEIEEKGRKEILKEVAPKLFD